MHKTRNLDWFLTNYEGFKLDTGNKSAFVAAKKPSVTQSRMLSLLVFYSVKNKHDFLLLNGSNSFITVAYDAYIETTIDYFVNHVFRYMTIHELYALQHISEQEGTQLLTTLALSV